MICERDGAREELLEGRLVVLVLPFLRLVAGVEVFLKLAPEVYLLERIALARLAFCLFAALGRGRGLQHIRRHVRRQWGRFQERRVTRAVRRSTAEFASGRRVRLVRAG